MLGGDVSISTRLLEGLGEGDGRGRRGREGAYIGRRCAARSGGGS